MELTLSARGLHFSYNGRPVLREVDLDLFRGEVLALVGPNGSGKSTLLRCLDNLLKPKQGQVLLAGRDLREHRPADLARQIGYVPQNAPNGFPATVREMVLLGRRPHIFFRVRPQDHQVVDQCLALLGLEGMALRSFDELSGGEQQKVLIARALAQQTDTLLLDEPTSNLDLRCQLEVLALLRELVRGRQLSLIIALHDLNLAAHFADRMVLLHKGRVLSQGSPQEVLTAQRIQAVYGVEAEVNRDARGRPVIWPQDPSELGLGPGGEA